MKRSYASAGTAKLMRTNLRAQLRLDRVEPSVERRQRGLRLRERVDDRPRGLGLLLPTDALRAGPGSLDAGARRAGSEERDERDADPELDAADRTSHVGGGDDVS